MPTRPVAICDPLPLMRLGLRSALRDIEDQLEDVGTSSELIAWSDRVGAGTAVLSLDGADHWTTLRRLGGASSGVRVVALVDQPRAIDYREAIRAGATSVISRRSLCTEIADVVRSTMRGHAVVPAATVRELSRHRPTTAAAWSSEERAWLDSLARGHSLDDMAHEFGYSRRTMARRLGGLYARLGASRQGPALAVAGRLGLIEA